MRFRVGPWMYRVQLREGLQDQHGTAAAGLCDCGNRIIYLSADMPAKRRLSVLLHELRHAWQEAMGTPADEESDANQAASFAADAMRQLLRQGGEIALERLTADGMVDWSAGDGPAEQRSAQCPTCGGLLNMPIRQGPVEFDPRFAVTAAARAADCEFCGHAVRWLEAMTSAGIPTGRILEGPKVGEGVVSGFDHDRGPGD